MNEEIEPILEISRSTSDIIQRLSEALGIKMELVDSIWTKYGKEANGSMDSNGVLQVSLRSDKPEYTVVVHESTHRLRQLAPEAYRVFRDLAVQMNPMPLDDVVQRYDDDAATIDMAKDEVAAELAEEIFRDEDKLRQVIEEAGKSQEIRNAVQRFFEVVREVIQKLKQTVQSLLGEGQINPAKHLNESLSDMERAEQLWKEAYIAAKRTAGKQASENTVNRDNQGRQYSLNPNLRQSLMCGTRIEIQTGN